MADTSLVLLLSLIVFGPALGALVIALIPGQNKDAIRWGTLGITLAVLGLCIYTFFAPQSPAHFDVARSSMQSAFNVPWIPTFDIDYLMGVDGISFPLVMLTAVITALSMGASWPIQKHLKAYCILFLLLLTGMLGVFMALDFFLFYVFWEVMLLPMYFLIGVWGGPRKEYAAIKFFIYTLAGSVLMLIAILMLYFTSDLRVLAEQEFIGPQISSTRWADMHLGRSANARLGRIETTTADVDGRLAFLRRDAATAAAPLEVRFVTGGNAAVADYDHAADVVIITAPADATAREVALAVHDNPVLENVLWARPVGNGSGLVGETPPLVIPAYSPDTPIHTFNILALSAMGQNTDLFTSTRYRVGLFGVTLLNGTLQHWAFWLLFIGFIIKVPSVPLHTWLPDAHVEAPTPISMILAGVLLKMGGYGIIRICYPICPAGGYDGAYLVCLLGVVSMVYGAFAALAQKDFKRMVAYSSVSHMGYVVLGLGVWSATAGTGWNWEYWNMGVKAAMFQMIGHGIVSPGMFFMVGVIYDRVHHRNLDEFGGLFGKMPVYTALAMGLFFAGLGLPGLVGFPGEVWSVLATWKYSPVLAIIAASVVIITAAYILWAVQRVYLGAEYRGPHEEDITPSTLRENWIGGILLAMAIFFGVYPYGILVFMDATIDRQVRDLAAWTRFVREAPTWRDVTRPVAHDEPARPTPPADEPLKVSQFEFSGD
jgi:NADH-quinone oxidoreductase subunit M